MKVSGFWVLLFVLGTALILLTFSSNNNKTSSSIPDVIFAQDNLVVEMMAVSRKLKENGYNRSTNKKHEAADNVKLDDYNPIDPVPSSKASVQPGPIEHGSPFIPYIPKPSPPSNPGDGA